jgi:hypothetical protein
VNLTVVPCVWMDKQLSNLFSALIDGGEGCLVIDQMILLEFVCLFQIDLFCI